MDSNDSSLDGYREAGSTHLALDLMGDLEGRDVVALRVEVSIEDANTLVFNCRALEDSFASRANVEL